MYTRSTGLGITELNLFYVVHMSTFSYFLCIINIIYSEKKGKFKVSTKKKQSWKSPQKNVRQALRGKKLKSVLNDKWPEGGETGLGRLAVLSQAATFYFVFCFLFFFFFYCFFWAEIRKKGVKKECLRFSCKINEQVYVERFNTTFILNVQFFVRQDTITSFIIIMSN